MTRKHAVILLSGGIDSAVCLALAADQYDRVTPVHFDYGQQTEEVERWRADMLTSYYKAESESQIDDLETVEYGPVFWHFSGGVASDRDTFVTEDGELEDNDGRSTGYVPMRNLHFIATGAGIADVAGADAVFHGMQGGDEEAYPDCRPAFRDAASDAVNQSLADSQTVTLETPLISLSKAEVIQMGDSLDLPFEYTYSCYEFVDNPADPEPCGRCPACVERIEAFEEAGVADPVMQDAEV